MSAFINGYLQKTAGFAEFLDTAKDFAVKNKEALIGAGIGGLGGALAGGLTGEGGLNRAAIGGSIGAIGGGMLGHFTTDPRFIKAKDKFIGHLTNKDESKQVVENKSTPAPVEKDGIFSSIRNYLTGNWTYTQEDANNITRAAEKKYGINRKIKGNWDLDILRDQVGRLAEALAEVNGIPERQALREARGEIMSQYRKGKVD